MGPNLPLPGIECAIGRLLLVGAAARLAPHAPREDWAARAVLLLPGEEECLALADHWSRVGAMEHASVASFARATLQLLAIGAPSDLVHDTQTAGADEVRHAQIAYGLASTYAGGPIGPGPLALGDAMPALDPRSAMHGLVDEACVSEVLGAAEALAASEACTDPVVRAALLQMAADESRHAALAWRTLGWVFDAHPALVAEAVARLDAITVPVGETVDLPAYGVLGATRRAAVHATAIAEVVAPAIAALREREAA
jgi:hypothetical protein